MVHGTVTFLWLTTMPGAGAGIVPERVSLAPLRDLVTMRPLPRPRPRPAEGLLVTARLPGTP